MDKLWDEAQTQENKELKEKLTDEYYIVKKKILDSLEREEEDLYEWVLSFTNSAKRIDNKLVEKFDKANIKENFPIKVYRGLRTTTTKKKGESFILKKNNKPQSWTTNLCIARNFAGKTGKVVSVILNPEDVLVDLRLLYVIRSSVDFTGEAEVISKDKDFEVTLEEIVFSSNYHSEDYKYELKTVRYDFIRSYKKDTYQLL